MGMIHAKNYETVSKFVKVMPRILWPLFSRTRCTTTTVMSLVSYCEKHSLLSCDITSQWSIYSVINYCFFLTVLRFI